MNSENLSKQGQNTGEDKGETSNQSSWEKQAKYFQSQKDKLYEENQSLQKYAKLGEALKTRPDVVKAMKESFQNPEANELKRPENFDPWEAYNDPKSESYKYRMDEMANNINSAVDKKVAQQTSHLEQEQGIQRLEGELRQRGMNQEQIGDFIKFTESDPSEFGIDNVLTMYNAYKNNDSNVQESPLDPIKRTQETPAVGGVLNGQMPEPSSDEDDMWDGVLGAGRVGNKIP